MSKKVFFITNICAHYSIKLYEALAAKLDIEFYFTGGEEAYWDKRNEKWAGNFKGHYLKGFFLFPKFRITPGLFGILCGKFDILIKTIDDRFALPLVFLAAKVLRKPFIFWVGLWHHPQTLFHRVSFFLTKAIYLHSDAVVVYGEHIKAYLMSLGVPAERIFCAPHAIDNSRFNGDVSAEERARVKSQLGLARERVLLYVGRLEKCKGLDYFIRALAGVRDVQCVAIFIGAGAERAALEQQCRDSGVNYRFLEFVPNDNLYKYYAIADIFILPSITTATFKEPWGLVINEAMNQGCPVITTDAVGAAAGGLVISGENGLVVPEKDERALRDAIQRLLTNEGLRSQMSAVARSRIKVWTQDIMAQGFINAIKYVQNPLPLARAVASSIK